MIRSQSIVMVDFVLTIGQRVYDVRYYLNIFGNCSAVLMRVWPHVCLEFVSANVRMELFTSSAVDTRDRCNNLLLQQLPPNTKYYHNRLESPLLLVSAHVEAYSQMVETASYVSQESTFLEFVYGPLWLPRTPRHR